MRRFFFTVVILLFLSFGLSRAGGVIAQTLLIDEYGQMVLDEGQVLSEGSDNSKGSGLSGSGSFESGSNTSGSASVKPTPIRTEERIEKDENDRLRTEMRTESSGEPQFGQEVREESGIRRIRIKNGRLEIRIKPPEKEEEKRSEVEEELEEDKEATGTARVARIRVRPHVSEDEVELEAEGEGIRIRHRNVGALTGFPLSLGPNNKLIITTPAGTKEVAILPDEAVRHLLQNGILTQIRVAEPAGDTATESAELSQELELEDERGVLVYKVKGVRAAKLFGFLPVSASVSANVSAETGAVTSVNQPWFFNFFGFLFR